ncbi:DUF1761 domain-containing protein [Qingshengfaniella alkalisoli]|uniref:DUF1761 domain-containing protein n=1 Tax=Qingshengfaniella alkalisoli TaxID=2599296 RepID=A0A5B8IRQ3_9RHOB|nr:DUF1761 domain-containing protein [Qingshengfaniella alkalisoli]QDY68254.1 DUF1761 domain-containing protein [Qingshengfaniella alkalisoli]
MEWFNLLLAAAAPWVFGAAWYGIVGERWMRAAKMTKEQVENKNPLPFVFSYLCMFSVAAMMNYVFERANVTGFLDGTLMGAGLGLFLTLPWSATNHVFSDRHKDLIWIDGVFFTVGCGLIGLVLVLF